jgi:hypothetical protein
VLPFWISIGVLSLSQAAVVALSAVWSPVWLGRLRSGWWALIPAVSVIGFVAIGSAAETASATALTYIALLAVPALAAFALGWSMRGARPWLAAIVPFAFVLAWSDRGALPAQSAALLLSALSCVALGALLGAVTPVRWLALGIVAMALADSALVVSDLLQQPNNALNAAHPAAGLPRLQYESFGSAAMGYGDLFVAGVLGGLLAVSGDRGLQSRGAALVALLAIAFDLLFFAVDELPATVPVALGLLILLRIGSSSSSPARAAASESSGRGLASTGVGVGISRSECAPACSMRRN